MNWDAVGALAETIGAVAVVSTILYLAIQVRDGRKSAESDAIDQLVSGWSEAIRALGETNEIASVVQRGLSNYNELDASEMLMFHTRMDRVIMAYNKGLELSKRGLWELPPEIETAVLMFIVSPGGTQWWEEAAASIGNSDNINQLLDSRRNELIPASGFSYFSVKNRSK